MDDIESFSGFDEPLENWSKLPNALIAALPLVTSLAELKVILYVLRHTWGYKEYQQFKPITTDEFANGRKRKDGTRIDPGIGMSEPSVRSGINSALEHGFIKVEIDSQDLARVEKSYRLNINAVEGERSLPPDEKNLPPEGKKFTTGGKESFHRSEKDTLDEKPSTETNTTRKREKKSKTDTIPASQMNPMKDAIVAAVGWNSERMTKSEWGIVQSTAKELCTAGFEPDRIMSYYAWCKAKYPDCSVKILATKLSEYRASRLATDNKPKAVYEADSGIDPSWADIPELKGIKRIIR